MTTYRLMDGVSGRPGVGSSGTQPPLVTAFTGNYIAGCAFEVTSSGMQLDGYWWWCPSDGQTTSGQTFALWQVTGTNAGTLVSGSSATAGTLTAGAFNFVPLATPVQLSVNTPYCAATGYVSTVGFPKNSAQFGSGNPYSAGITNGPLTGYSSTGGSNTVGGAGWLPQEPFNTGSADPTSVMPVNKDVDDNLWLDIQVSSATGPIATAQPGQTWLRRFHHRQQLPPAPPAVTAPQAGPPVYPLGHPVQARQLPRQGGRTASRGGTYGQAGPPVRPAHGPVKAQPAVPVLTGRALRRAGTFAGLGPAVKALAQAITARLRVLPARGRTAGKTGTYAGTGPPVTPPHGAVRAQPAPQRGGRTANRTGTFTQVTLGSGPPVYPLGHPVQARRLPQRGGTASGRRGTYAGSGPAVTPPHGPAHAAQPLPPRGRTQARTGIFTLVVTGSGPPVYPLGHPVQARRLPARPGAAQRRAGTFQGAGPAVTPQKQPAGLQRRQPPPPARGRTASQRGPYGSTGPPVIRLRRPARGQPQVPLLTGRAGWHAGTYTAPFVPPFTIGALTAADKASGVLTAAGASSALTAATAAQGTLTATDQRTGGPG